MTEAPGLSTMQAAVQIAQNILQCGMEPARYAEEVKRLHELMAEWAFDLIREQWDDEHKGFPCTLAWLTHEENEDTPEALAYWAATSQFFRKVYQACASAA